VLLVEATLDSATATIVKSEWLTRDHRKLLSVGEYPFLLEGYPNSSQIIATTLARDEPQKVLDIAPYELLNFVEIGAREKTDFLVLVRENNAVWDIEKANRGC
jgi:hypothetical protein